MKRISVFIVIIFVFFLAIATAHIKPHNAKVIGFEQEDQEKTVSVLGAVRNPGAYDLISNPTLLQILSRAGGFTKEVGKEIIVLRMQPNKSYKAIRISFDDLVFKGDEELNISLQPNDIINVPIGEVVCIYIFGEVANPSRLNVKKSKIPTLLRTIAMSGGLTSRATKEKIVIKRTKETGGAEEIIVNLRSIIRGEIKDIQLQENDVVIVSTID